MNTFERYFVATNRWALILLLAAMSVIIFANVALRYLTNASIEWAEEVARHMMIWLTFIGSGMVMRYGGHIAVENLQDAFPRPISQGIRVVVAILLMGFFIMMTWTGYLYTQRAMFQLTAATQIPFGYIYAAIPTGGLLLCIHFALVLRSYITDRKFSTDANFDATASASI
ncbi:TRAP transporter small permease [Curvibacter sp. HBC61]|uniref:TRAP transporter small permease protein n=1 Tax=Curvibacter cyanobacteriorum TaxID=3026422 RepID=A0ABT5N5G3_9BURK|nr:TRAP transporter small permease [Curvibacter sp. HBC61]MDD0840896.1 TRAP transporter small permease [Curvibacter sp. HBC61]